MFTTYKLRWIIILDLSCPVKLMTLSSASFQRQKRVYDCTQRWIKLQTASQSLVSLKTFIHNLRSLFTGTGKTPQARLIFQRLAVFSLSFISRKLIFRIRQIYLITPWWKNTMINILEICIGPMINGKRDIVSSRVPPHFTSAYMFVYLNRCR